MTTKVVGGGGRLSFHFKCESYRHIPPRPRQWMWAGAQWVLTPPCCLSWWEIESHFCPGNPPSTHGLWDAEESHLPVGKLCFSAAVRTQLFLSVQAVWRGIKGNMNMCVICNSVILTAVLIQSDMYTYMELNFINTCLWSISFLNILYMCSIYTRKISIHTCISSQFLISYLKQKL